MKREKNGIYYSNKTKEKEEVLMNNLKRKNGITLIALVITIIVLLILAGVTIATLTGDNGILSQAQKAKESTEVAKFRDAVQLAYMTAYSKNAQNGTYTVSMTDLIRELNNDYPEYNQAGKIESRESGSVLSIVAKLGDVELNDKTSPLILGTGETKTIVIEPTTPQGAGGTKFVNLEGKYYQIILDGNGVTLGEAQDNLPESENELEISKGEGLGNVSATEKSDLNVEIKAGSTLDAGNITFTYGTKSTTVAVQVKTKYTVTAEVYSGDSAKGSVSISPSSSDGKYAEGSKVNLTATANTGYQLEGWYNGATKLSEASQYEYTVPASNVTITAKFKEYQKYGATAQLGTVTVNSTELSKGWKYFLEDTNNIYLIYANYLESAQIPAATNISTDGYNVYASGSRDNLVNYLKGETSTYSTVWSGFATGVENALNAKLATGQKLATGTVKAYGAPTVEQFKESYLGNYPTSGFDANYVTSGYNAEGYVYKVGNGNYGYSASLGNSNKALYFPETTYSQIRDANANPAQTGDTYGYWLARSFS